MLEMEKKLFKSLHWVNFDTLYKGRLGGGSGGKKNLFEAVVFGSFDNV